MVCPTSTTQSYSTEITDDNTCNNVFHNGDINLSIRINYIEIVFVQD